MKKLSILICLLIFTQVNLLAQIDISQKVIASVNKSASKDFLDYFNDKVETHILSDDDIFSKEQAVAILEKFFKDNPVKKLSNLHESKSKNDTKFIVADILAGNSNYRMSILIKKTGEIQHIHQFRIETAND
jgi:hypothetical protein